jgi:hypothetical protein
MAGLDKVKAWAKGHKVLAYGGAGVALFGAYEVYNARKNATATANPLGSTVPVDPNSQLVNPGAEQITLTGGGGGGGSTYTRHPKGQTVPPVVAPVAATPTPTATPARTFGQGIIDTINGPMVWLGVTGQGGSTAHTYQVGGGAPVYFGNAQSNAIGGTSQAGVDVYTPVADENLVSLAPS